MTTWEPEVKSQRKKEPQIPRLWNTTASIFATRFATKSQQKVIFTLQMLSRWTMCVVAEEELKFEPLIVRVIQSP